MEELLLKKLDEISSKQRDIQLPLWYWSEEATPRQRNVADACIAGLRMTEALRLTIKELYSLDKYVITDVESQLAAILGIEPGEQN